MSAFRAKQVRRIIATMLKRIGNFLFIMKWPEPLGFVYSRHLCKIKLKISK